MCVCVLCQQHSPFFAEQLTAFQVWLTMGVENRNPPEQLPIVLQVQVHTHSTRSNPWGPFWFQARFISIIYNCICFFKWCKEKYWMKKEAVVIITNNGSVRKINEQWAWKKISTTLVYLVYPVKIVTGCTVHTLHILHIALQADRWWIQSSVLWQKVTNWAVGHEKGAFRNQTDQSFSKGFPKSPLSRPLWV